MTTETKTYDKRDRAVAAALKELGSKAIKGLDYDLETVPTVSGQKTVTRYIWVRLHPIFEPKTKDRVFDVNVPSIHGTVIVAGPNASEVKWDSPEPWGKVSNTLNKHLRFDLASVEDEPKSDLVPASEGIPEELKVANRKPLTDEQKVRLNEITKTKTVDEKHNSKLPRNVEPAGLEILRAQEEGKRKTRATDTTTEKPTEPKRKGRRRAKEFPPEHVITVVVATNPKQQGSAAYDLFAIYRPGMTVAQYLEKAGPRGPFLLRYDTEHKFITIG